MCQVQIAAKSPFKKRAKYFGSLSIAFAVWPYLLHFQTELENFVTKQSVSGCAVAADNDGINEEEGSLPLAPLGSGDGSSQVHAVRLLLCILGQVS